MSESKSQFGEVSEAKTINSNWLTNSVSDTQTAVEIVNREISRKSRIPFETKFVIDSEYVGLSYDSQNPTTNYGSYSSGFSSGFGPQVSNPQLTERKVWLGSTIKMTNHLLIAPNGSSLTYTGQVTKLQPKGRDKWEVTMLSISSTPPTSFDYTITTDQEDLLLTDVAAPISGRPTNVLISDGVTIGATSSFNPALTTGDYPDGLFIVNRGKILGAGGRGGDSGFPASSLEPGICHIAFSQRGFDGGPALSITGTTSLIIDNGIKGLIYGGGGGGAGYRLICLSGDRVVEQFPQAGAGGQGYENAQNGVQGALGGLNQVTSDPNDRAESGSIDAPGFPRGGASGENGGDTLVYACEFSNRPVTRIGGTAGNAIIKNGNDLLITDGDNGQQIKGGVI